MKIEINQKDLLNHIHIAQRAISSRTTLQILSGMYFKAEDNFLTIMATDLELFIETKIACLVHEEGEIVLNSNLIGNIARKLPNEIISIEATGQKIVIQCGQSRFDLLGQAPHEYPLLPKNEQEVHFQLGAEVLKAGTHQTVFATSQDQSRPYLTGVLLQSKGDSLHMVALDGFRVAFKKIPLAGFLEDIKVIIPSRGLEELDKITQEETQVDIYCSQTHILFDLGDTKMYSRLIEGNFINYEDIITEDYETLVQVDKRDFQRSLERANLLAQTDKANLVKLFISDQGIDLSSNTEIGSVKEFVPSQKEGADLLIAFNARYLLDGLKVLEEGPVTIRLKRSIDPVIMRSLEDEDYTYLALPVRLAGEMDGYRD